MENKKLPDYVQEFIGINKDLPLHLLVSSEIAKRPNLKRIKIAKGLNRTPGAISQALNGDNDKLLFRVIKYILRYDRQRARKIRSVA